MNYTPANQRYASMEYRYAGDSGLKVPALSLGLWHNFGSDCNRDRMKQLCFTAFDQGITYFDLANNYGPVPGSAEENFGLILQQDMKAYRDEMLIATKAGYGMWEGPYGDGGSRKYLIASLNQSLKRMNLDYVDIFYHHRMDPNTPLEETMLALRDIVASGKALYVGLSNYDGETMTRASALLREYHVPFVVNQNNYSLLNLSIEQNGLQEACTTEKKGIVAFCPLAQGLLTNRYLQDIPQDSRVKTSGIFLSESNLTPEVLGKVKALHSLAEERGQTLAQMALSFVLAQKNLCTVLIGASKPEQILENVRCLEKLNFTEEELSRIRGIL